MDFPQIVCQTGFGAGALAASPTWTDISSYVMSFTTERGRQYELNQFEPGTLQLTLLNDDGRFDPMYQSGPYYGNLLPHKQIRVGATYGGTTYWLFRGLVERWEPIRIGGKFHSVCNITATDVLALFNNYRFPRHDGGNGAGSGRKLLGVFDHHLNTYTSGSSFTGTDEATRVYALCEATYLTGASDAGPFVEDVTLKVTYTNGGGTANRVGYVKFHHNVVSQHPSSKWARELDLQLQGNDTVHSIQKVEWKSGKFHGSNLKVLFYGERPIIPRGTGDVQLTSMLKRAGWPSSMVTVRHAGRFTQTPSSPWGGGLLEAIQEISDTECGQIYVDRTGKVVFEDRDWRINHWPSSPTHWGDGAGSASYVYSSCEPSLDNEYVVTEWQVTRDAFGPQDNPVTQVASSQTAESQYGTIVGQRQVKLATDALCKKQARYLLARTKNALYRVPSLIIKPRLNPTVLFPAVLPMEISDGMFIDQNPPNGPASTFNTVNGFNIDHVSHSVTPDDWETELVLSPGMDFHIDHALTYFFNSLEQTAPFKVTVYPQGELPTKDNSEVILVEAYSASTRTGGASVAEVTAGHSAPGSVDIVETVVGSASASEVQTLTLDATSGTFTLSFGGSTTAAINWNDTAATVQTRLRALASIGATGCTVTGSAGGPYTVTFTGSLANAQQAVITADVSNLVTGGAGAVSVAEVTHGGTGVNEVQSVTVTGTSGTFTLTFGGQTTDNLAWNITADALATELQLLSSIGSGNVEVEGATGGPYTVTFQGTLGGAAQALMTADATLLTSGGVSEVETVTIDADAGTFKLSADGGSNWTAGLAYNASAATVQTALQGLAAVGSGNCHVDYDSVSGVYTVTWCGGKANSAQALTSDASSLTVTTAEITSCIRAQDGTTARSILVGDHCEVTKLGDASVVVEILTGGTTYNDWAPSGYESAGVIFVRASGSGAATITGLAGGTAGRRVVLLVSTLPTGSASITLSNQSASSATGNQLALLNEEDIVLPHNTNGPIAVMLEYLAGPPGFWTEVSRTTIAASGLLGMVSLSGGSGSAADDGLVVHIAGTETVTGAKTFSTSPVVPTASADDNSTKAASTAYVTGQLSASGDGTPAMDGTAARGTGTHAARADHVHPTDTSRAADSAVVHLAGTETVTGIKTLNTIVVGSAHLTLASALAADSYNADGSVGTSGAFAMVGSSAIRVSGASTIYGCAIPTNSWKEFKLVALGAVTIKNNTISGTAPAASQIRCSGAADIVLAADDIAYFFYDNSTARWRCAKM